MKSHLILGFMTLALASGAAHAAGDDKKKAKDPNEMICKSVAETGTRLARKRICMTRQQMEEQRAMNRDAVERSQGQRPSSGN